MQLQHFDSIMACFYNSNQNIAYMLIFYSYIYMVFLDWVNSIGLLWLHLWCHTVFLSQICCKNVLAFQLDRSHIINVQSDTRKVKTNHNDLIESTQSMWNTLNITFQVWSPRWKWPRTWRWSITRKWWRCTWLWKWRAPYQN